MNINQIIFYTYVFSIMDVRRSDIHITLYEAWSCPSYALHGDAGAFRSVFIKSHLNFLSLSLPLSLTHTHTHTYTYAHTHAHTHIICLPLTRTQFRAASTIKSQRALTLKWAS